MDETVALDVASQVNGWKKGQEDGEDFAKSNPATTPDVAQVENWAAERNPESEGAKQEQWNKGYVKGFKDGYTKGLTSNL